MIPVDALFTPVQRVNYQVSHTRVGQDTNFDSLALEVWTDGTIDGQGAVAKAAGILREQLLQLQQLGQGDAGAGAPGGAAPPFDGHDTPIESLELSVRAYNCLKRSGLVTVGAILERSEDELLALRNFGEKSYQELHESLVARGFPAPRGTRGARAPRPPPRPRTRPPLPAPAAGGDPGDPEGSEGVGSLGTALLQALREAGEDAPDLAGDA